MLTRRLALLLGFGLIASLPVSGGETAEPNRAIRFMLEDPTGKVVNDGDFLGSWLLVYLGYTSCPDLCPTSLARLSAVLDLLGDKAERIAPIFITVDPARDTREVLAAYVPAFDERIVALRGPKPFVDAAVKSFGAQYRIAVNDPAHPERYSVDHTTWIALVDPWGQIVARIPHDADAGATAGEIEKAMAAAREPAER